jgi:hypothetical protein
MADKQTDPYGYALELAQRRQQWEQEQRERKAQQQRRHKQRELEQHLTRRGKDYVDHTGQQPTREDLEHWQRQYLDEQERMHRAKRAAKLGEIEKLYP